MNDVTNVLSNTSSKRHTSSGALIVHAFELTDAGKAQCKYPVRAIIYNKNINQRIYVNAEHTELYKDQVIELHLNGQSRYAFIKELQQHPVNGRLVHVDLFMPDESYATVTTRLPINFTHQSESEGLKRGGLLYITSRSLPVRMQMDSIVPFLNISVSGMNHGQHVRSRDVAMPAGIENLRKDLTLATLIGSKGQ
jgi:large subunit ribosomal protein L25